MPVPSVSPDSLAAGKSIARCVKQAGNPYTRNRRSQRPSLIRQSQAEQHPKEKANAGESYSRKFKQRNSKDIGPDISAAYKMAVAEAEALGIPRYALPRLSNEPTLEEAREVQERIESIIASFTSANI